VQTIPFPLGRPSPGPTLYNRELSRSFLTSPQRCRTTISTTLVMTATAGTGHLQQGPGHLQRLLETTEPLLGIHAGAGAPVDPTQTNPGNERISVVRTNSWRKPMQSAGGSLLASLSSLCGGRMEATRTQAASRSALFTLLGPPPPLLASQRGRKKDLIT